MSFASVLIANRGEIAIRIARGASELGIRSVAVYSEDDASSLHTRKADEARALSGSGPAAYLDGEQIIRVAKEAGCDAIHPGYGFLAENPSFARRCAEEGITFIGPNAATLELFGDKVRARELARNAGVPIIEGTPTLGSATDAVKFMQSLGEGSAVMLKAVAGGGGRGSRAVTNVDDVEEAFTRCQSEALSAFGDGALYAERYLPRARHIEVQVIGDGTGAVAHLWERECSIQRRFQKVVEVAPSVNLPERLRASILDAAVRLAGSYGYDNLGTFEFLVDANGLSDRSFFAFIETNPRLQVEHTVTEEVLDLDLVKIQFELAAGKTLEAMRLTQPFIPAPRGRALQARVNMERMDADGTPRPTGGTITAFEMPSGRGVRADTFGYTGYTTNARFDSLLGKVIVHSTSDDFSDVAAKAYRALCETRIDGVQTNLGFLLNLLRHPDFVSGNVYTTFVDTQMAQLLDGEGSGHAQLFMDAGPQPARRQDGQAGTRLASNDPLAVLDFGRSESRPGAAVSAPGEARDHGESSGFVAVPAPIQGTIVQVSVAEGDTVVRGQQMFVMDAMKMEHVVAATVSGVVRELTVSVGDTIFEGHGLAFVEPAEIDESAGAETDEFDLDHIRDDLRLILDRHAVTLDEARPDAVARRRKTGQRTARENINDLCDPGSFMEHGGLVLTPNTGLPLDEVIRKFPGDGMVCGVGSVNGRYFAKPANRCVVISYDYTVLAGTQGAVNHPKTDRMLELAEKWRIPVVFFTEGGGGRAGTGGRRDGGERINEGPDVGGGRPLDTPTFTTMARLSGLVPLVGVTSGRCFAGNAALLGCCDVIIATKNSNIAMGGPAMIEGGGLGVFAPEEVGPFSTQVANGVIDIAVDDEEAAVAAARQYVSYFQGTISEWEAPDQRQLRFAIPENRLRVYDVRKVIETLADTGSVLELRRGFGHGMVTAFIRIEGKPIGVIASNPAHLAGAVDSDGADKAARFMQLLDAFDIPLLVLMDTPGMMVGPEVEKTGLVRHCCRLFVTGANLTVPHMTIVLRKGYGLAAQAMAGGSYKEPFFTVAWPTGEFGGMGLEGQVKLGYRNELAAIEDPQERLARYNELVARAYERSKAIQSGVSFAVDDVIDPAESRTWITQALDSVRWPAPRHEKKRRNVDTW